MRTRYNLIIMTVILACLSCDPASDDGRGEETASSLEGAEEGESDWLGIRGPDEDGTEEAEPWVSVMDTLTFTSLVKDGIAPGFNVDGVISEEGDPESCGHGDFISPDGEEGIDNQLAMITPLLDLVGLGAVHGLIQSSIEQGGLLLVLELEGLDDVVNDEEVGVTLRFGAGSPLLGTDGQLLSGQTYQVHSNSPDLIAPNGRVDDGMLTAGPFEVRIPIVVFDIEYEMTVRHALIRADLTYDGGMVNGMLGGTVPMSDLWEIAEVADTEAGGILDSVKLILGNMPDYAPDENGECTELSAALAFTAVSGFFPEDAEVSLP
jgi:hypothetical protein